MRAGIFLVAALSVGVASEAVSAGSLVSSTNKAVRAEKKGVVGKQQRIRPEQLVRFVSEAVMCPSEEQVLELAAHISNGEMTLANAMLAGNGGPCISGGGPGDDDVYRVLSVKYADFSNSGIIQIIRDGDDVSNGTWWTPNFYLKVVSPSSSSVKPSKPD